MFHKSLNVAETAPRDREKKEVSVGAPGLASPGRRDLLVSIAPRRRNCLVLISSRSAGACPPRALDAACTHDGEGNPLACACGMRGPKPYGEGAFFVVARGPVPRELQRHDVCFPLCSLCSPDHKRVRIAWQVCQSFRRSCPTRGGGLTARRMARDRPSPYVNGRRFFIVARGPSDATRASERVSPATLSNL